MLFVALFLFGVIASLFGPIKYGILPDHLARSELPAGNALVEGATFIAILLGTIVGGIAAKDGGDPANFALLMILFALMCWGASLFIPPTGQAAPNLVVQRNVLVSTAGLLSFLREDPRLWWGGLVTSWFWLVGAVALSLMPPLVRSCSAAMRSGHRMPRDLFGFDRDRIGACRLACRRPHHLAADGDRRRPPRPVCD